jgi:hypothetical protein
MAAGKKESPSMQFIDGVSTAMDPELQRRHGIELPSTCIILDVSKISPNQYDQADAQKARRYNCRSQEPHTSKKL